MADLQAFDIVSYNCRGFNTSKEAYIRSLLLNSCCLVFARTRVIREPITNTTNTNNIDDCFFLCTGVSGFDNSDVLRGRRYGTCVIYWRSNVLSSVISK